MQNLLSSLHLFGHDSGAKLVLKPIAEHLGLLINDNLLKERCDLFK